MHVTEYPVRLEDFLYFLKCGQPLQIQKYFISKETFSCSKKLISRVYGKSRKVQSTFFYQLIDKKECLDLTFVQVVCSAVLDRRPKFYGRSRRFRTYGYGYSGRSFRPFLRPQEKFEFFVVFSKMEAEMKVLFCFSLHRCHMSLDQIRLLCIMKIKTHPLLMRKVIKYRLTKIEHGIMNSCQIQNQI